MDKYTSIDLNEEKQKEELNGDPSPAEGTTRPRLNHIR